MARRPEHVKQNIRDNETASCVDGVWYLCRETSVRVPGIMYPVKQSRRVAISYPGRRVELEKPCIIAQSDYDCYEFGFSYAVYQLCPVKWRNFLKDDWEAVLLSIIKKASPESFFVRLPELHVPEQRNIDLHEHRFWKEFSSETMALLNKLRSVHIIYSTKTNQFLLTRLCNEHNVAAKALGVQLEECDLL